MTTELQTSPERGLDLSYTVQVFPAPLYFSREGSGLGNLQNVYTIKKFASAQKHINRSENYRSPH